MMNTEHDTEELNAPLSILQRLDRLEHLLLFMEKHSYARADSDAALDKCLKPVDQCKSLSSALEEAHHKGTLMERVSLLENRVNQLSINMDLGNTSRSSSSTCEAAEKLGHGSGMNMVTTLQEKQNPLVPKDSIVVEACSPYSRAQRRHERTMPRVENNNKRKWLKWLKLRC